MDVWRNYRSLLWSFEALVGWLFPAEGRSDRRALEDSAEESELEALCDVSVEESLPGPESSGVSGFLATRASVFSCSFTGPKTLLVEAGNALDKSVS